MPGPRRSEDAPVVSGESVNPHGDERSVDATGRILVTPMPRARTVEPVTAPAPRAPATMPTAPERRSGPWLVILVYVLAAAALGYAIWERFVRT